MFLKNIKQSFTEIRRLKKIHDILVDENDKLKKDLNKIQEDIERKSGPEMVLEKVMDRGIEWFDYYALKPNEQKMYYANAQSVLRNKTLINESNHLIADWVEYIAKHSKDFNEVMNLRMSINAIELRSEERRVGKECRL